MKPKYIATGARFSDDKIYRYTLERCWSMGDRAVAFVGLNPSKAGVSNDDPTVRREIGFARQWGFNWYFKVNIYAYVATKPADMYAAAARGVNIKGPANAEAMVRIFDRVELIVAAWGQNDLRPFGGNLVAGWIAAHVKTRCLGHNKNGTPKHPLYLRADTALVMP